MNAAIEAEGLVKTYPGDVRALDGVGFTVAPGTIFGLLGPNGAGKSTTVKILTTLSRADAGSARVAGLDVLKDPAGVRRAIGVVGQKNAVDGEATGRENLLLQGRLHDLGGRALRARVDDLLERFRLADAADRFAKTYSGGMQRRLDVALGLVARPQVLFLDEPTTGLDPEVRVAMWQEIEQLAREEGLTILLTTHYLEEADQLVSQPLAQLSIVTIVQSLIIVGLGLAIGADFNGGAPGAFVVILAAVLLGTAIASLSIGLALVARKEETVIATVTSITLPLTFLSGAFMNLALAPAWIRDVAKFNPLNWAIQAGREALTSSSIDWGFVGARIGLLVLLLIACAAVATRAFRSCQRSV